MTQTAFRTDSRSSSSSSDFQMLRDFRSHRTMIDSRVSADSFSPRALLFAMPMASLLWLAGLVVIYPYL